MQQQRAARACLSHKVLITLAPDLLPRFSRAAAIVFWFAKGHSVPPSRGVFVSLGDSLFLQRPKLTTRERFQCYLEEARLTAAEAQACPEPKTREQLLIIAYFWMELAYDLGHAGESH